MALVEKGNSYEEGRRHALLCVIKQECHHCRKSLPYIAWGSFCGKEDCCRWKGLTLWHSGIDESLTNPRYTTPCSAADKWIYLATEKEGESYLDAVSLSKCLFYRTRNRKEVDAEIAALNTIGIQGSCGG